MPNNTTRDSEQYARNLAQAKANIEAKRRGIGVTKHATDGRPIAGLAAMPQNAKPSPKMLRKVRITKGHPGVGDCFKRWHLYKNGDTLLYAKATEGLTPNDLTFWAKCGYIALDEPTKAEVEAAEAAWRKATGTANKAAQSKATASGSTRQSTATAEAKREAKAKADAKRKATAKAKAERADKARRATAQGQAEAARQAATASDADALGLADGTDG